MAVSSSSWRAVSETGSKVLTNPVKLGSELLEQLRERLILLDGHATIVAATAFGHAGPGAARARHASPLQPRDRHG